jgi:hypothetical protein
MLFIVIKCEFNIKNLSDELEVTILKIGWLILILTIIFAIVERLKVAVEQKSFNS